MGVYFVEIESEATAPPLTLSTPVGLDVEYGTPPPRIADTQFDLEAVYTDPYGSGGGGGGYNAQTLNKAWQTTGTPQWVYWRTDDPDPTGTSFPGPGVFGTTTNYGAESIVYVSV